MASDLLITTAPGKKKPPLKIRQHPKKGFYGEWRTFKVSWLTSKNALLYFTFSADGLKEVLVNNYDEINARMEEGTVIQNILSKLDILNVKNSSEMYQLSNITWPN